MIASIQTFRASISSSSSESPSPAPRTASDSPDILPASPETQLACSGDLGTMLAAMLLEASDDSRKAAKLSREASEKAEDAAFASRIQNMREAADQRLTSGIVAGGSMAAAGAAGIVGGILDKAKLCEHIGKGAEGTGKGVASFFDHGATEADIRAATDERAVRTAGKRVEDADSRDKEAKELAQRTLSHLEAILTAKKEAAQAALFRG